MVDLEIDESKLWDPADRQKYLDNLPEMSLFDDHILEGDVMVEAIQALIEEGETADTLALHWKTKGNEMFLHAKKHNKQYYEHAMKYYNDALAYALQAMKLPPEEWTENINVKELTSQIYSNRAAVELALKNYGSCRSDAAKAIRYDRKNIKAYFRGAKASSMLHKAKDTLRYCAEGLKVDPTNELLLRLQQQGMQLVEEEKLVQQKQLFERNKKRAFTDKYRQLCEMRNIRVGRAIIDDERVKQYEGKAEFNSEDGQMYWPVMFLYDEYGTSDFVSFFGENDRFVDHLANMFPEEGPFCDWDAEEKYKASQFEVYAPAQVVLAFQTVEDWHVALSGIEEDDVHEMARVHHEHKHDEMNAQEWIKLSLFCPLLKLLTHEKYVVPGVPMVHVFVRNSVALAQFLDRIEHRVVELHE